MGVLYCSVPNQVFLVCHRTFTGRHPVTSPLSIALGTPVAPSTPKAPITSDSNRPAARCKNDKTNPNGGICSKRGFSFSGCHWQLVCQCLGCDNPLSFDRQTISDFTPSIPTRPPSLPAQCKNCKTNPNGGICFKRWFFVLAARYPAILALWFMIRSISLKPRGFRTLCT